MLDRAVTMGLQQLTAVSDRLIADFLAQLDHRIKNCLRAWRATGQIKVNGDQLVNTANRGGGVSTEHATSDGAGPHGNHVLGLGHLFVEPDQSRSHLHGHGACNDQQVRLSG